MTKQEFEKQYAQNSGETVEGIREFYKAVPCNCGDDICEGWQMKTHAQIEFEKRFNK